MAPAHRPVKRKLSDLVQRGRERQRAHIRPGTRVNRTSHWEKYVDFLKDTRVNWRKAKDKHIIVFLESLVERRLAVSTVQNYLASIWGVYREKGRCLQYLNTESLRQWTRALVINDTADFRRQPYLRVKELKAISKAAGKRCHHRLYRAVLKFAFYSMMRISNYTVTSSKITRAFASLSKKDITVYNSSLRINLTWSKAQQKKAESRKLVLAATGDVTYPVRAMRE